MQSNEEILVRALQQCHDEADHTLGTEADEPLEIARANAEEIKRIAKRALKETGFSS